MRLACVRRKIQYGLSYLSRSSGPLKVAFVFLLLVGQWLQGSISYTCVRKTKTLGFWLRTKSGQCRTQENAGPYKWKQDRRPRLWILAATGMKVV